MEPIKQDLPLLSRFYQDYLQDHTIKRFLDRTSQHYSQSTLIRLGFSENAETRRAAALVLGWIGDYQANDVLGRLLKDNDRSVRLLAENSIKNVWPRDGSEEQRHELREIMRLIAGHEFEEAVRRSNNLLEEAPLFAEARNQRAIALFALGDFQDAIEDAAIVLDLNPFHFGAAIGMGHSYLHNDNKELAIVCFQHSLSINPNLESVRKHLERMLPR